MHDYDVIVVGGGSAGSSAAAAAHAAGASTAMINDGELGGLCILRGCMPTKALLASAHAIHDAGRLEPFGAHLVGRVVPDFAGIFARKSAQVARFQRAKIAAIEGAGYEVLSGRARFEPGATLDLNGRRLSAHGYVIATGSTPVHLPLPGVDEVPVWTSDDVMRLEKQPRALLIQGAGPIGLELAQLFARIGTEVTLVNRSPLLVRQDPDAGRELTRALEREPGMRLCVPGAIRRLRRDGKGLVAEIDHDGSPVECRADALLMAVGRRALLDDLGLEHLGLRDAGGLLDHDETMRTSNERVFVAGDATGAFQILHLANQEGTVAGHNAAGGRPVRRMDYRLKMQVVFTDPPYAAVGRTPAESVAAQGNLVVGSAAFPETGRAITMETEYGLWKLLADGGTGEILGTSCLGPRADDLVHLVSTVMHYRGTVDDLLKLPWYHPTLSEVLLDLARDIRRQRT